MDPVRDAQALLKSRTPPTYSNIQRLHNDIISFIQVHKTLRPQINTFQGGGRMTTLCYLYGVLPITYKNATYNIPVTWYFDPPYPKQPPRCFVTPADGMVLDKLHPSVDQSGMIHVPYLNLWNDRASTLMELAAALISEFSKRPPVHSTAAPMRLSGVNGTMQLQHHEQPVATVVAQPVHRTRKEKSIMSCTKNVCDRWSLVLEPIVADINEQFELNAQIQTEAEKATENFNNIKDKLKQDSRHEEDLQATGADLSAFVKENAGRQFDPDELRTEADPDSRQVLDCLAEELALDEFLNVLDDLLGAKKISIEDFLREVRDVSRRQFFCRAQRRAAASAVVAATTSVNQAVVAATTSVNQAAPVVVAATTSVNQAAPAVVAATTSVNQAAPAVVASTTSVNQATPAVVAATTRVNQAASVVQNRQVAVAA